jgi:hypothetical protein
MVEDQSNAIAETLNESPLCQKIISFLVENQTAMDTLRGIAICWVGSDEPAVQAALDRLILCGTLITHRRRSGTLYALTPDVAVRNWLRQWGDGVHTTPIAGPEHVGAQPSLEPV